MARVPQAASPLCPNAHTVPAAAPPRRGRAALRCLSVGIASLLLLLAGRSGTAAQDPQEATKERPRIEYEFSEGMRFGLTVLEEDGARRRLTYSSSGSTNSTLLKIDGEQVEFGSPVGEWAPQQKPLEKDQKPLEKGWGSVSCWVYKKVKVTQQLEVVKTRGGEVLDSCKVTYKIENTDSTARNVALRVVIDTLIVDNDGCPFYAPARKQLLKESQEFSGKAVPNLLQPLQYPNPEKPGYVAELNLKDSSFAKPHRLQLAPWKLVYGQWNVKLKSGEKLDWDSAVVMYWEVPSLPPGGSPYTAGYIYGKAASPKLIGEGTPEKERGPAKAPAAK
jgi:hypothetical protein